MVVLSKKDKISTWSVVKYEILSKKYLRRSCTQVIEVNCLVYDLASGTAFVDGYLPAVDKSWSDVFYAAGDVKVSQMPELAEPIVGS